MNHRSMASVLIAVGLLFLITEAAGNMIHDGTASLDYGYDPENRIKGAAGFTYTGACPEVSRRDADGNRVEKASGTTGTLYWYMTPGIVAESDLAGNLKSEYVFFNGERVARKDFPGNTVSYYFSDHLKTASVITDAAGNIKSESDYSPWGRELSFLSNDSNPYKFGGHEHDAETGNYNYGAREYSPGMGRFLTPDWSLKPIPVPYADFTNPQTLNKYAYAHNNPTTLGDPDGHCSSPSVGKGQVGICVDLYIAAKILPKTVPLGFALGDNRGPAPNDPKATYRVELKFVVDPANKRVNKVKDDAGVSIANAAGITVAGKGQSNTTVSDPTKNSDGTTHFSVSNTAINGLSNIPLAPKDTIKTDLNFAVTSDGKVGLDPGAMRTAYPSIEIYSYSPAGTTTTIFQNKESGNLNDLQRKDQPIPEVQPH